MYHIYCYFSGLWACVHENRLCGPGLEPGCDGRPPQRAPPKTTSGGTTVRQCPSLQDLGVKIQFLPGSHIIILIYICINII